MKRSRNTALCGASISRLQFRHGGFRLPYLLGPLTVLTKGLCVPLGHKAVYTGQNPFRYRIRAPALLRVRIRTIDTAGLAEADASTHLLDRSLVGCSYTLHLVVLANLPSLASWPIGVVHYRAVDSTLPGEA